MKIKVGIFVFETDKTRMFLPVSTNDSFKIGNLNCGGLSNVLNQELMEVAVLTRQKKFIGVCRLHGETSFSIARTPNTTSKLSYKCCICSTTAQMKSRKKKGAAA